MTPNSWNETEPLFARHLELERFLTAWVLPADMGEGDPTPFSGALGEHAERIKAKLDAVQRSLAETPMVVLVFGPGPKGKSRLYRKRERIRKELNTIPGVTAFFPEDDAFANLFRETIGLGGRDPFAVEIAQARAADVIIALEPGPGVEQEVAILAVRTDLAAKLYNLLPDHYAQTSGTSLPGLVRQRIERHYYTEAEVKQCDLATKVCPTHVKNEQVRKAFL